MYSALMIYVKNLFINMSLKRSKKFKLLFQLEAEPENFLKGGHAQCIIIFR